MIIYGAGLAGLLAGCHFPKARLLDSAKEGDVSHKALLRFRTPDVGRAVGIEFRPVKVNKGIWYDGNFVEPNIRLANMYSQKVIGRIADRSIWNLQPVERYIAPNDFIEQLIDRCAGRITWGYNVTADDVLNKECNAVSTMPLFLLARMLGHEAPEFNYKPISVRQYHVPGAGVYQTVYFPDSRIGLYRASMTGDLLIVESTSEVDIYNSLDTVVDAFGLRATPVELKSTTRQTFGKIDPVDDAWRKKFIFELSHSYGIYSLGRFGTWRNILLDDVLKDISVIKKLMNTSTYERRAESVK